MTGSTPQYTKVRLGDDYFGYGTPPTGTNKYGTRAPKAWTDEQAAINWANYQADNPAQYRDPLYDSNGNWITGKTAQNSTPAPTGPTPTGPSPSTSGMTGSGIQSYQDHQRQMQRNIADPTSPWYGYTLSSDGQVPRPPAPINYAAYNQPDQSNNYQQPRQPIPGSWADQMQQRTATRYPTTTAAGQINASSPADQRQQNITNSQATRTQAQIESQRITPEEIERNRISMEEQGPLFADQMAPYKEKSLSQGSGPAQGYNRIYGGEAGSGYRDVLSKTGGGQTSYAPSAIGNNTPITPPPSRWPAPNQPDTSNNYQQPQLTYGPRQTAETGWVPSPQPQSSQFGFDYGPPPQMSDRVSRLAGAGAPAKVPAWMTAGNKQYLLQRNR
jgi:hypothetical protein